jgi:hypothetical protein
LPALSTRSAITSAPKPRPNSAAWTEWLISQRSRKLLQSAARVSGVQPLSAAFPGATTANHTVRPAVTQKPAATVQGTDLRRHHPGQQDRQQLYAPDDSEFNVQILLDNQPGCAVQPQFAGYLHDMTERHAKGQRHQQQAKRLTEN